MHKLALTTIGMSVCLLSGCANINATKAQNAKAISQANAMNAQINHVANQEVSFSDRPYLGNQIIAINESKPLPAALKRKITMIRTAPETLTSALDELSSVGGIDIVLSQNAIDFLTGKSKKGQSTSDDKKLADFIHTQLTPQFSDVPLSEALNRITRATNLFWRYDSEDNRISIFRSTSCVFKVPLPTSAVSTNSSISSASSQKNLSGSDTNIKFESKNIDPWADLITSIQSISDDLSVKPMKSQGLLLVHGTPDEIDQAKRFIDEVKQTYAHGVMIKAYVYNIKVNRTSSYGINWNAIYKTTHGSLAWNSANLSSGTGGASIAQVATSTLKALSGPWSGSDLVVNALQNNTNATQVTGGSFFSVNGMPTPISDVRRINYIKAVNVTTLGGSTSSSNNVQKSVEPGTIQVGYVFNITPEILSHDQVLMHLSIDISKLNQIKVYKTGGADDPSSVQLPDMSYKKLIQTLTLKNGQTAVITGFGNANNSVDTNSIGNKSSWWAGGNQGGEHERTLTVLVITPYIMGDSRF